VIQPDHRLHRTERRQGTVPFHHELDITHPLLRIAIRPAAGHRVEVAAQQCRFILGEAANPFLAE
jgi:hypothetical protein